MKKSFLTIVWTVLALGLWAESVTPDMAKMAADAWVLKNSPFGAKGQASSVLTVCDTNAAQTVLWHQVSMSNGGMLVVAPVTEIEPVLVALEKDPGALPKDHVLRSILQMDVRRRLRLLGLYAEDSQGASLAGVTPPKSSEETAAVDAWGSAQKKKWARLGVGTAAALQEAMTAGIADIAVQIGIVDGFEQGGRFTHWNQAGSGGAYCYNYYTPNHAVCGCVATACSALVQAFGATNDVGNISAEKCTYNNMPYFEVAGTVRAPGGSLTTLGGAIDWNILPSNYGGTNAVSSKLDDEQRQLLGRIAFDAGVGVSMGWTDSESGAIEANIAVALREVFGFKNARALGCSGTEEEFSKLIWNQCWCGRPVGLGISAKGSSGGHSVLAVGYGKDADGVDRVRIFCGWGGSGDGWYALPYIQTHGTLNGATVNYNIVDSIVTMISSEDDNIVPVVGHITLGGAPIEVPGLNKTIMADENGYFSVLVPANLTDCRLICCGKEATFEIGAEEAGDTNYVATASKLLPALPDMIEWPLLNASVAFSFDDAKLKALAEGKAILRISGVASQTNTQALVNYIYNLDDKNVDCFTNRFVYFYSSATSSDPTRGDGRPSYGVFLPTATDEEGRWLWNNGRLSYGYVSTVVTNGYSTLDDMTNAYGQVTNNMALGTITSETTNMVVYTETTNVYVQAVENLGTVTYETFDGANLPVVLAAQEESLRAVLNAGWDGYLRCMSGISLTVADNSHEAGVAVPSYGLHANCYTNGEVVTATCAATSTNADETVVMGCTGWTLSTNGVLVADEDGMVVTNEGARAVFSVATSNDYTLTWLITTNLVKITVGTTDNGLWGTVTPGTGWYPYGEPVIFTAKSERGSFASFASGFPTDAYVAGYSIVWTVETPVTLYANFGRSADKTTYAISNKVAVTSLFLEDEASDLTDKVPVGLDVSGVAVYGLRDSPIVLANATTNGVPAEKVIFKPAAETVVAADGSVWTCLGLLDDEQYYCYSVLGMDLASCDTNEVLTVCCLWQRTFVPDPQEYVIEWNEGLDNLSESFVTNLMTATAFAASGLSLDEVAAKVTVPKGWKASLSTNAVGDVVAALVVDEAVLMPVAPEGKQILTIVANADGTLTVEGAVANGVIGFWYSIYGADELTGPWSVVAETPCQAKVEGEQDLSLTFTPSSSNKFYKLVVTSRNPSL